MHAQQRGDRDAEQPAESLGLPADATQGAVKPVVVLPHQPVDALVDLTGPLLTVDHEHPRLGRLPIVGYGRLTRRIVKSYGLPVLA